jgi:hypothetical protein
MASVLNLCSEAAIEDEDVMSVQKLLNLVTHATHSPE